jgi:hypothetical protein
MLGEQLTAGATSRRMTKCFQGTGSGCNPMAIVAAAAASASAAR